MLQPRVSVCDKMAGVFFNLFVIALLCSVTCQDINDNESIDASRIKREGVLDNRAFNTNAIVYDNTPWRPGREIDITNGADDERKLKNLATRIMSNGVEVLVRDKSSDGKQEQRKIKVMQLSSTKTPKHHVSSTPPNKSLLSSAVATVVNRQQMSAFFPLHQLMQHNYIIKTCMTTYTYLTTVVQNKRSAISTFETIVSVVTTESLTNLYATDVLADLKPTKTKYMEVKTIQPSATSNMFLSNNPKIEKRIDSQEENNFDLIEPSELGHMPCTSSCTCSHTKTESLKTKYTNAKLPSAIATDKYLIKTTKYSGTKLDVRPTHKEAIDQTLYRPYEYETSSQAAPTDKIVEKFTQVNDYSDEKDSNSVETSDLLTNEQAPPSKHNNISTSNTSIKPKPDKNQKINKNKFVMAELIKLGSLGIKGLSQLAPVIEKMTGGFMKRQETNKTVITTTTVKPVSKLTIYNANKRVDNDLESKVGNFPIYIPVDEMKTSESQISLKNVTLHQNFAWATDNKHSKGHLVKPKIIYESPLLNGGIPISPGEIITANSDVIVGKPAVGGPLTLVASGIKLQNPVHPPLIDSVVANNDQYLVKEKPMNDQTILNMKVDDSFDLRPPELPKLKSKPNKNIRPHGGHFNQQSSQQWSSTNSHIISEQNKQSGILKNKESMVINHGRPAFLDFIPSLNKHSNNIPKDHQVNYRPSFKEQDIPDNNPSSSEVISTKITTDGRYTDVENDDSENKPFLVDIQPSRVANVLIPHGSSTALVFAGSSEPHKTGDYIDDPLPYPEPGYFGSFSIDAPHMTNVHNVVPNKNQFFGKPTIKSTFDSYAKDVAPTYKGTGLNNDQKVKWNENKRPKDLMNIPPPTSNQESHIQVGPQITAYNPEIYKVEFDKNSKPKEEKDIIDKEYENYLAVPPPPPKRHYNQEIRYDKKRYQQRPIVHTKPIHDSNVFLNIQHPISNQLPPKVTSEIYFASQLPNNQATPTYSFKIPQTPTTVTTAQVKPPKKPNEQIPKTNNAVTSSNATNKSVITSNTQENSYTITLNTAANVASESNSGKIIGSSISVPITTTSLNGQINANIPIGTNFAIRVEDDPSKYESVALHGKRHPSLIFDDHEREPGNNFNSYKENNFEYQFNQTNSMIPVRQTDINTNIRDKPIHKDHSNLIPPSVNSHANFPMINEDTNGYINLNSNYADNKNLNAENKPISFVPEISTNSHGWYASVLKEDNLKNIKVEASTRKIIPLNFDNKSDSLPEFGEKIATVGKPPEFWDNKNKQTVNNFSIGRPFSKTNEGQKSNVLPFTIKPNYIPSNFGNKQPVYDIPLRDNSNEVTTTKIIYSKPTKTIYETAEEIYDGEEESENNSEIDGEVSSESMKIPIITTSVAKNNYTKSSPSLENVFNQNVNQHSEDVKLVNFNPGTQTEKPFTSFNKTTFQSNNIKPIYDHNPYMKPRPFTINTAIPLDHQLQQPHWQINQLMENSTNASYEDNMELNIGEEKNTAITSRPYSTRKPVGFKEPENKYKNQQKNTVLLNNMGISNESNIITSTIQIQDKKPLIVELDEKTTLKPFTIKSESDRLNSSLSEIIDLSPPPPTVNYNFKPSINDEIMGMSPPPPRNPLQRVPSRIPQTPRPILPMRTPAPYRTVPPKTLPPRQSTQRPVRKPLKDEVSTYRPNYDIVNKVKRPSFNIDQPSSHLLPPPRELPSKITSIQKEPKPTISSVTDVVFPTAASSSWLTSSNFDFSSSFNFGPSSVYFPDNVSPTKIPEDSDKISLESSSENIFISNEYETSSEAKDSSHETPVTQITVSRKENNTKLLNKESEFSIEQEQVESSKEDVTKDRMKVIPIGNKNRTRKPYPIRNDDKKSSTSKFKLPSKTVPVIRPTRTLSRPELSYPTRLTSIKKIIRPLPSKPIAVFPTNIIESSESSIEEEYIKPTEVLKEEQVSTESLEVPSIIEKTSTFNNDPMTSNIHKQHHAGNEIKISDEIIPTKTEFRTTIITLTKTLSEPPQTVSSIGYINLTHTLTVTHTKTTLVSQSEGAVTQTLILTNTHTSTIVDVVTEIYTKVQPTTIVETVTKHIPIPQVEATSIVDSSLPTKIALDDITMSSEERDNFIIRDNDVTENIQKIEVEEDKDNDTFFVVMNKSQNGGKSPPIPDIDTGDYDVTRNEQVNNNGVSQVLFGEILLAGTPYLETTNVVHPTGVGYGKECQPDCKASRNERCQRIDGIMKCVCRPGFARMFPDRPCKPTYTYSVRLALGSQGNERLKFHTNLSDNSSKEYHSLAVATHEGINRMVMQSDLRDVYHGVHITGFHPIEMLTPQEETYQGVINDFYVQLSDNAHESRLKEVIEKYLRNNNYSLGGTEVHAAEVFIDRLNVSDFDECISAQFHDCSEHARCFNLRGTYTCSCLEGYADLSVNTLYPGRICSSDAVGCAGCNYHGTCFERESAMICECFKWYAGRTCQVNLKAVLITVTVIGLVIILVVTIWASKRCCCQKGPATQTFVIGCMQGMPSLHQGNIPSKQRADRRALIAERMETAETCSVQNTSLPYIPSKSRSRSSCSRPCAVSAPPAHAPPPPPAPALMIPRARLHPLHSDSRDNLSRKKSTEICSEAKLISYLESGATNATDEMRRKHSMESSYSVNKERSNKQGALVSAGFKVSTTVRPDDSVKEDRDDASSINKTDLEGDMSRFDTLRKTYSQEDISEWTDAERRIGELTLSEARSVGGTLPASTGRAASSTRLTHQEANTMAERDLGSTFLLPHVHLYKSDLTSDVSEFDSL
ncbi:uncharacterized protein LOC113393742 isoform X2 [Vanessa tameamea]|uniref:Uncharacterized protein LOC113393742 isoform X2 n=1 Tax=Vanessa tameamea TaxID=334116 RepID=A0ABM4AV16_VANTA